MYQDDTRQILLQHLSHFHLLITLTATDSTLPLDMVFFATETVTPRADVAETLDATPENSSDDIMTASTGKRRYFWCLYTRLIL